MKMITEAVGAGHPDKICDQIADNILDKFMEKDPFAKVACEVFAIHNQIYISRWSFYHFIYWCCKSSMRNII